MWPAGIRVRPPAGLLTCQRADPRREAVQGRAAHYTQPNTVQTQDDRFKSQDCVLHRPAGISRDTNQSEWLLSVNPKSMMS